VSGIGCTAAVGPACKVPRTLGSALAGGHQPADTTRHVAGWQAVQRARSTAAGAWAYRLAASCRASVRAEGSAAGMRLVPWSSWGEWAAVGGALLAGCADGCGAAAADAATAAAARVATWRVRGRLPLAVEVTAALAEARAQDAAYTGRPGACLRAQLPRRMSHQSLV